MAAKPLIREEIAKTEKKLDMPLDDIIKMSKITTNKAKKQRRAPNKSQKFSLNAVHDKALKVRSYMDTRPFVRQGVLAQRRSNFQGNQFPLATEAARKAAVAPFRNRPFNRNVMTSSSKPRIGAFTVQRAARRISAMKSPQQQQGDGGSKQRPKTLDSMFANMKEQRMKVLLSRQNNVVKRNRIGNGNGGRPRVPWARGRFGN